MRPVVVRRWLALATMVVAAGLSAPGCRPGAPRISPQVNGRDPASAELPFTPPVLPARPSNAYAGSAACAACHATVSEKFHAHAMGRSLAKVGDATPLEAYGEQDRFTAPRPSGAAFDTSYYAQRTDEGVFHHEVVTGRDGKVLYDQVVPVEYEVGSGQRGRSYLVNRQGILFMSPITWYSGAKRWDLSPGYQLSNLHFSRRILFACVNCHAGRVDAADSATDRFAAVPFIEESISCERCHGPAAEHVDYWSESRFSAPRDPILKLAELPSARLNDICFQCHLIGEQRVTRYGRSEFDFRPGDDLSDVWTVFVKGTGIQGDRTTEAVSQVEQMLSSACYQRSNGQLRCVSCHDPHSTPAVADRDQFYRARCLNCHGNTSAGCSKPVEQRLQATSLDSCIHCHMPAVAANDVPHTSQTDHRVLRSHAGERPAERRQVELQTFASTGKIPEAELDRARALAMVKTAESTRNAVTAVDAIPLLERWLKVVPDDLQAIESLGAAYYLLQESSLAATRWEQGLKRFPNNEYLMRRLFLLSHESGQNERGIEYGRRLIEINAWDYEYFGRLAHMLAQAKQLDEATHAAERALQINPSAFSIHSWLADAYAAKGDLERSREHRALHQAFTK